MPTFYVESDASIQRRRQQATVQVRAKFPNLIEGSSGWIRAFNNRLRRIA